MIDLLAINDCIVTIDAMRCQKEIAEKNSFKDIQYKYHLTRDKCHRRNEITRYYLVEDINWLFMKKEWKGLKSIGMAVRECEVNSKTTIEKRYFISSLNCSAEKFGQAVRKHLGIESMHWFLDVTFSEDKSRVRKDYAPENLSMLKRIALNMLKKFTPEKKTRLKLKRFNAAMNEKYLEEIIIQNII